MTAGVRPMALFGPIPLQQVDTAEVTILMDNVVDLLSSSEKDIQRPTRTWDWVEREQLRAEHGFSALVTMEKGGARISILYDAGLTPTGLVHNLDVMEIDPRQLRAIALSHGHADHHGGLEGMLRRHGLRRLPLVIHPEAWRERKISLPTGQEYRFPPPSQADLEREGAQVVEERGPSLLLDDAVLISGEVERTSQFERGNPAHFARVGEGWEPDPLILDDQNLIVNVRNRGLVIVSGCSHAGAVNVIQNAIRLTGETRVAGYVGGLHLTGPFFEPLIAPTVESFAGLGVARVAAGHCTGWRAGFAFAQAMGDAYVQPTVGTRFRF
jgi:7,8-dihydropterin-6-yl-methyl-4-(beta-D-ribofuranosyl)aminobenzene 5'-phosphate synthase